MGEVKKAQTTIFYFGMLNWGTGKNVLCFQKSARENYATNFKVGIITDYRP